ncbi:DUF72 domain-containing protein [Thermogymnomonas acidicola]|uniref:DUF72 domain-containing protein n=1 Tax=Thermogymnomonas acidicola TaxID=399579 RepID=UPI001662C432|nr:DUF72 domain-containing protein [Thermogymnomonas acidicola]
MEIRVGCSGWFYNHWSGLFYPEGMPKSRWFQFYSSRFDTVEINSSFYTFPRRESVRRWARAAPEGFIYSVKAHRSITHEGRMRGVQEAISDFYSTVGLLGGKLGCILFQFPPSFRYSDENLSAIIGLLDRRYENVVEFRHRSWLEGKAAGDLIAQGIHVAAVSSERMPFVLFEDSVLYIRMHGDQQGYATDYSDERLLGLAREIVGASPRAVYVYFNNDYRAMAPKNASTLITKIREIMRS